MKVAALLLIVLLEGVVVEVGEAVADEDAVVADEEVVVVVEADPLELGKVVPLVEEVLEDVDAELDALLEERVEIVLVVA